VVHVKTPASLNTSATNAVKPLFTRATAPEHRQHVPYCGELHSGPSGFLPAPYLDFVDPQPVLIREALRLSLADQALGGLA
jgi:hypothetical protein